MVNYDKWANVGDSDDSDEDASAVPSSVAELVPAGAETLPVDAAKAFLNLLCDKLFAHMSDGPGLDICVDALQQSLPAAQPLATALTQNFLATHFYFPECLPPRWRGREQLRLAGEVSAQMCITDMLEELQFGVITRDALFKAAGNPPGHPEHAKLEARLSLKPGHFLLVAQLATPDGRGWLETRELPYVTTTQLAVDPLKQAALEQLASGLVSR